MNRRRKSRNLYIINSLQAPGPQQFKTLIENQSDTDVFRLMSHFMRIIRFSYKYCTKNKSNGLKFYFSDI